MPRYVTIQPVLIVTLGKRYTEMLDRCLILFTVFCLRPLAELACIPPTGERGQEVTRVAREVSESGFYHVVFRGNGRQELFLSEADRIVMVKLLERTSRKEGVRIVAWCLMGNHVHLLVRDESSRLSAFMHCLLTGYARYFNQKNGHVGHVFQERFSSFPINDDAYLLATLRYIHQNPERAGICRAETYRWSSFGEYVGREDVRCPPITDTEEMLDLLGGASGFTNLCATTPRPGVGVRCHEAGMSDEEARVLAASILWDAGLGTLGEVKALAAGERGRALRLLLEGGFSIRQVERLTGVGRGVISRARSRKE